MGEVRRGIRDDLEQDSLVILVQTGYEMFRRFALVVIGHWLVPNFLRVEEDLGQSTILPRVLQDPLVRGVRGEFRAGHFDGRLRVLGNMSQYVVWDSRLFERFTLFVEFSLFQPVRLSLLPGLIARWGRGPYRSRGGGVEVRS